MSLVKTVDLAAGHASLEDACERWGFKCVQKPENYYSDQGVFPWYEIFVRGVQIGDAVLYPRYTRCRFIPQH